ncbi:MAG: hypothetical protein WBI04_01475 [Trichlorobacter sp.]
MKKRPRDICQLAKMIVDEATNEEPTTTPADQPEKNKAAQELGRLGGLKGGKARADKLTPEQRREIAQIAAQARWEKS